MDDLSLTDADLVLFERRVVLSDQHGGGDAITAAFTVLKSREERKKGGEDKRGKHREGESEEKMEMTEEERMKRIEDKVTVCICGLDNSPADAVIADPDLRRSSRRSGPRRRRRSSDRVSAVFSVQFNTYYYKKQSGNSILLIVDNPRNLATKAK